RDPGRKEVEHRGTRWALLLQPLVAFDAPVVLVLGLAFFPGQLDPVDAAVSFVEHVEVVDEPAVSPGPSGGIGADAVVRHRDELLVLRERRERRRGEHGKGQTREREAAETLGESAHVSSFRKMSQAISAERAIVSVFPWRFATAGRARGTPRPGRR